MGYRSDVYLKTTKDGYRKLRDLIRKDSEAAYEFFTTPDEMKFREDEQTVTMKWEYMKWYEEYKEIGSIMSGISEISETYPVDFIRLGENLDDIEERWDYPNDFHGDFDGLELHRYVTIYGKSITDDDIIDND